MTKIAACLIVRNSAEIIEQTLTTIRPHVDEINVYDTGSTDTTIALLKKLGEHVEMAVDTDTGKTYLSPDDDIGESVVNFQMVPLAPIRVKTGKWRDDFGWAREQSFAMASEDVDWLLWLDDDDQLVGAEHLRQMAAAAPPELDGYIVFYDYARDETGTCICQLWRERLIRRSAGYRWDRSVHEVLVPPEGRPAALMPVPPNQVKYVHNRPPDRYPNDRNLKILQIGRAHV